MHGCIISTHACMHAASLRRRNSGIVLFMQKNRNITTKTYTGLRTDSEFLHNCCKIICGMRNYSQSKLYTYMSRHDNGKFCHHSLCDKIFHWDLNLNFIRILKSGRLLLLSNPRLFMHMCI